MQFHFIDLYYRYIFGVVSRSNCDVWSATVILGDNTRSVLSTGHYQVVEGGAPAQRFASIFGINRRLSTRIYRLSLIIMDDITLHRLYKLCRRLGWNNKHRSQKYILSNKKVLSSKICYSRKILLLYVFRLNNFDLILTIYVLLVGNVMRLVRNISSN